MPTVEDDGAIIALAGRSGLALMGPVETNEVGLDFRVAFAPDESGAEWVLRVPRRDDVWPKDRNEARVLAFLKGRLPVDVPDWRVVGPDLIAYPRLPGTTAVTVDPDTHEPTWHIDKNSGVFLEGFAAFLAALHSIDAAQAAAAGLRASSPEDARRSFSEDLDRVVSELGVAGPLLNRWRAWLDDDASWPGFSTLVHGDLHVGHVLVDGSSRPTGVLDWTEAEATDPSVDFIFHLMGFGEEGLERLLKAYEAAGGRTWPGMARHVAERLAAFPVKYALYALTTGNAEHLAASRAQLNPSAE